jgi:nucleoside 2-deoxyribosyltransferase
MKLYLAGPLFTQAERAWNLQLADRIAEAGHDVFLPQVEVQAIQTLDADTIFRVDVDGVRSSDAIVAVLDGADPDSGTSFECGLAFALGLPIVLVRTDFRAGGDALPGQKLATVNLMLSQASTAVVALTNPTGKLEDLARLVVEALGNLPESLPRLEKLKGPASSPRSSEG